MHMLINGSEHTLSDFCQDDLARAVVISLFSWRRAEDDDDLPGDSRFGWWADTFNEQKTGSRLWLLLRSKLTEATLRRAKMYAEEALQWLIDDGVAGSVEVTAERGGMNRLDMSVTVTKPDKSELAMRFQDVWSTQ